MKRLMVVVALTLAMPAAAQRIASDFEIAQMEKQVATSRDFLSQVSGHLNLGDLRLTRNEVAAAHAEYLKSFAIANAERLRARKDSELARYATATAYEGLADAKLDRAAESMAAFDEALRYASDDAKTWNLYSTAMQAVHRDAKAISYARNAVALATDPLDLNVYRYSLATALIDSGESDEARGLLETVVAALRSPQFDAVRSRAARSESFEIYSTARGDEAAYLSLINRSQLRLASLYERSGNIAAAKQQYENVLAGRSDDVTALAAMARLTEGAERERYYAAAFDANPLSMVLIRQYRAQLSGARMSSPAASVESSGATMRTALQQLARGEHRAARATLDQLASKYPNNATIEALKRETDAPAVATLPSPKPTAFELRQFIDAFERLTPAQRASLDALTFTSVVVFDTSTASAQTGQTVFETGAIDGVPFRFSEPTTFAGVFPSTVRLTYRILGASGDALLLEPLKVEK